MSDTKPEEINVDELMAQIRHEVSKRKKLSSQVTAADEQSDISEPQIAINRESENIKHLIKCAESEFNVGGEVTSMEHFRNRFVRMIARLSGVIILYLARFITAKQRRFNKYVVDILNKLFTTLKQDSEIFKDKLADLYDRGLFLEGLKGEIKGTTSLIETLQKEYTRIDSIVENLQSDNIQRSQNIEKAITQLTEELNWVKNDMIRNLSHIKDNEKAITYLKSNNLLQDRRLTMFIEEARKRLPSPFNENQLKIFSDEEQYILDAFFISFEDQFRGTREDIKNRARVYLPFIEKIKDITYSSPVLDIGCGRGEWLELLKDEKIPAQGLDINPLMVEECKNRGLEAISGDALQYLRSLDDNSIGVITGFHIIEHLPFNVVVKLFDETRRVLKAGGLVIFETPNPQNILVGSYTFYMDPTHLHPLPSSMIKFVAEARGFCRVEIVELHPYSLSYKSRDSELAEFLNTYFYGPQDYAVIGWKA